MSNLNIPIDFLEKKGSELFKVQGGFAFKSDDYSEDGYFLVRIGNVGKGRFDYKDPVYVKVKSTSVLNNFLIKENDVLMGLTGDLGKICFVEKAHNLVLNQRVARFLNDEKLIDKKYLYYLISSEEVQETFESFFAGGAQKNISPKKIEEVKYLLPSNINEQKKIAEILTKVDEAIENTEQLIQKYEQVKVGLMQDLLTKGIDENGNIRSEETHQFKDSPLGRIPVEWDFGKFKSLCKYDITYGIVQAGPHIDNGVPYIKTGDLTGDNFKISNLQRTSAEIAKRFSRSKMELGEIVFALRGDIGNSKIITQEFVGSNLTQGTARISFNEDHLLNRFAIYMFQMPLIVKQIEESQKGTTFQEISLSTLRNFMINYPKDINEQEKIINALDRISKKIDLNKTLLKKIKLQKQGLMQDLLAGKVRVNY